MMVDFAKTAFWPNNLMKVDSVKTVVTVFLRSSISLYETSMVQCDQMMADLVKTGVSMFPVPNGLLVHWMQSCQSQ